MTGVPHAALDPENAKLVTLARGARARIGAAQGAAVRDDTGRTYVGATVAREHLAISAVALAVANAAASGARGLEAVVVVTAGLVDPDDLRVACDLGGAGVPVFVIDAGGTVTAVHAT